MNARPSQVAVWLVVTAVAATAVEILYQPGLQGAKHWWLTPYTVCFALVGVMDGAYVLLCRAIATSSVSRLAQGKPPQEVDEWPIAGMYSPAWMVTQGFAAVVVSIFLVLKWFGNDWPYPPPWMFVAACFLMPLVARSQRFGSVRLNAAGAQIHWDNGETRTMQWSDLSTLDLLILSPAIRSAADAPPRDAFRFLGPRRHDGYTLAQSLWVAARASRQPAVAPRST